MQASEVKAAEGHSRELLTFTLGHEEYGIDILKVQEICGYDAVTMIANSPAFIKGVINLRGIIVPVILKTFFCPRKARKSRNKSISYSDLARHPSDDVANRCIYLNLFVFFRVFRG